MTEITKIHELESDIKFAVGIAPFATLLGLIGLYCICFALTVAIEWVGVLPLILSDAFQFLTIALFFALFAIPFGFIQFTLIGGWTLRRFLARFHPNPVMIALLALTANSAFSALLFAIGAAFLFDGLSYFAKILLIAGAMIAPVWGFVAALLIRHRQNQRSEHHV